MLSRGKKKLYKIWVKTRDEEDYIKYRLARRHNKKVENSKGKRMDPVW